MNNRSAAIGYAVLADDRTALTAYLRNGGPLVLFGADWAYELQSAETDDSRGHP